MIWLNESDFPTQIKTSILNKVIEDDAGILHDAERKTLSEIESYLNHRFDMAQIWNKSGNDRNAALVMFAVDILIYHIHRRLYQEQANEGIRATSYDEAKEWLKMVAKGDITPDLPPKTDSKNQEYTHTRWGSDPKRNW